MNTVITILAFIISVQLAKFLIIIWRLQKTGSLSVVYKFTFQLDEKAKEALASGSLKVGQRESISIMNFPLYWLKEQYFSKWQIFCFVTGFYTDQNMCHILFTQVIENENKKFIEDNNLFNEKLAKTYFAQSGGEKLDEKELREAPQKINVQLISANIIIHE